MKRIARFALAMALLGVIALTGWWLHGVLSGKPRPPAHVLAVQETKIDVETLETMTLSVGEWLRLGAEDGRETDGLYRNPKTGRYTMAPATKCGACGATIPALIVPRAETDEDVLRNFRLEAEYRCRKCGKRP